MEYTTVEALCEGIAGAMRAEEEARYAESITINNE